MGEVIGTAVSGLVSEVQTLLTGNLPVVFGVFAGLIGLGLVIRLVTKLVGKKAA